MIKFLCCIFLWQSIFLAFVHSQSKGSDEKASFHNNILLFGEPKSGTSWATHIARLMIRNFCVRESNCTIIGNPSPYTPLLNYKFKSTVANHSLSYRFAEVYKHHVPHSYRDVLTCVHEGKLTDIFPCNIVFDGLSNEQYMDMGQKLKNCVQYCHAPRSLIGVSGKGDDWYNTTITSYIYMFRDPRDVIVSHCYFLQYESSRSGESTDSNKYFTLSLPNCIRKEYPKVALWIKFREMMIAYDKQYRKEHKKKDKEDQKLSYIFCYEALTKNHTLRQHGRMHNMYHNEIMDMYMLFAKALGFEQDAISVERIEKVMQWSTAEHLISMKNTKLLENTKLRAGGDVHFTDAQYELPSSLIQWMNDTYRGLERIYSSPCTAARESKLLV